MPSAVETKRALRREIRTRIANTPQQIREAEAAWVFNQLQAMPQYQQAHTVLSFWSMPDELPTHQANQSLLTGKRIVLPVVRGNDLVLLEYTDPGCLQAVPPYGIEEPQGTQTVPDDEIDLVIVPGVAFDAALGRMGRGKGYYDRLFARLPKAYAVGVCLSCQVVQHVPMEPHDKRVDTLLAYPSSWAKGCSLPHE